MGGRSELVLAVVLAAACVLTGVGWAQDEGGRAVEEIVVTARKRAEALEEVPVSVTALTDDDLQVRQVRSIRDLNGFVPNLQVRRTRTGTDASLYIRGIGTPGDEVFVDQAVGVYVDGVYIPRTAGSLIDILDFEQVEVLRGPQGTLFGKNTVGGALNLTTIKPQPELSGKLQVRAGNFDTVETRATLNVPLGYGSLEDKLLSRFSFQSRNTSGYTENTFLDVNWNDEAVLNFLGTIRFLPTDDITIDVTGNWYRNHGRGRGGECIFQRRSQFDGLPGGPTDDYYEYCMNEDRKTPFKFESNVAGLSDLESYGTWATAQWDVGSVGYADDMSFKLIGSWREQVQRLREDLDMSRYNLWQWSSAGGGEFEGDPGVANQGTVELQQTTTFWDDRISLVDGAFFYWEHVSTEFDYLVFPDSPISGPAGGLTKSSVITDNFSWALFMHGVVDVTDWLQLTAGIRYTNEEKGAARRLSNLVLCSDGSPCSPDDPNVDILASFPKQSRSFDRFTPMASLALTMPEDWLYDGPVDHLMAYFTYSQGFKGGGINAAIRTMDQEEMTDFDQEILNSYEIGVKTVAWDNRFRMNLAGYYGDYSDLQLPIVKGGTCPPEDPDCIPPPLFIIDNAGDATIAGAELEILLNPLDGLDVSATAAYQFTEFDDYIGTNVLKDPNVEDVEIDRAGERFPFVPEFSASVGIQYAYPIDGGDIDCLYGTLTPRVDWTYQSSIQYWGRELDGSVQSGVNLVNLRLGYWFWDDALELALWTKNVGDETYFDDVYQIPVLPTGNITRFYAPPRTFGGEINFRF